MIARRVRAWAARKGERYHRPMAPREVLTPTPSAEGLDTYANLWVAVVDGKVAQAAETSHELATRLHALPDQVRRRAIIQFVRPVADSYIIGIG